MWLFPSTFEALGSIPSTTHTHTHTHTHTKHIHTHTHTHTPQTHIYTYTQHTQSISKDMELVECSYTSGGDMKWTLENSLAISTY
jgi:hypothetical protein